MAENPYASYYSKKIDGKTYHRWETYPIKSRAKKAAIKVRKNGWKARVVKEPSTGSGKGKTYKYAIWRKL